MSNTQLHKDDASCPQSWPYQSTISSLYLRRHELNSVPFSTSLSVQIRILHAGHVCVLRQCLWSTFCILYSAQISCIMFSTPKHLKPWCPDIKFQNSADGCPAFLSTRSYISWLFPSPSHVDFSAFILSFPLTMGTSQAFLITENACTEMPPPKLCHRFLVPQPSNHKENKKIPSQLIWMSKRGLAAGLSDSHLLPAAQ